jgi:hypothetical protein
MVGYYLYRAQRSDQSAFVATGRVRERNGLVAVVIALAGTILIAGSGGLIAEAALGDGLAHRGEVLFATHAATDVCSPAGQTTVFGQSDAIFDVAIMRETVEPGTPVVLEIDAPGGRTAGPFPVTSQPPFDCLGGSLTTGPLDPGTYVVHYRYDGQPDTPDLATGTFTVRSSPGPSD